MSGEHFLHCANILYLICYGVRDVLLLRTLAVTAMFVIMPYYYLPDPVEARLVAAHRSGDHVEVERLIDEERVLDGFGDPKWTPISWNLLFATVNLYWIVRILLERRPPKLNPDQKKLYDLTFRKCTPREMLQLIAHAEWQEIGPNQTLIEQGVQGEKLIVLHSGLVSVRVKGEEVTKLGDGDFIGEMSFLTREPTVARVVTETTVRYLEWDGHQLHKLFDRRIDLKSALNTVIGHNLIEKLTSTQNRVPELSVISSPSSN